jgi:hypothetical protein
MADPLDANISPKLAQAEQTTILGQVAEWFKAAARKSCYTTQVVSEVRILSLSANFPLLSDSCPLTRIPICLASLE